MTWFFVIVLLIVVGYLLDREIYFYEGVHLGPRAQAWLYDRWSRQYDAGKRESQLRDDEMLAKPLVERLKEIPEPFVLDFATGTGRLSVALLNRSEFNGRIVALDLSQGMLEQAASKLRPSQPRFDLLRHTSLPLPFPDSSFDVVCALEVLELFPTMEEPLAEFARVLRPSGLFLTSRGTEESGRKAKVKPLDEYMSLLERHGFEQVEVVTWWKLFDRTLAVKQGRSHPVAHKHMEDVLQCGCGQRKWEKNENSLRCQNCGRELIRTGAGIVLG